VCNLGACASECAAGQTTCGGDAGAPYCATTQTDNSNCGMCGNTCGILQVCAGGTCASSCLSSQTLCLPDAGPPYCADTKNDNANCGSCGNYCTLTTPLCSNGTCISAG